MELVSEILKYADSKGRLSPHIYHKIPDNIKQLCLENNVTLTEYYHMVKCGYDEYPHCLYCGQKVNKFWRKKNHFYCSKQCAEKSGHANEVRMKTCQKKYGCINVSQLNDIKQKKINTCMCNFGVMWPQQSKEILEKSYETTKERYGTYRPALNKNVVDKQINTCIERYGSTSYGSSDEFKNYIKKHFKERFYIQNKEQLLKNKIEILTPKEKYSISEEIEYKCLICGTVFSSIQTNEQRVHCPLCIKSSYSFIEKEILNFIKSIYSGEIVENDRTILKPKELDIYIPEKKLAIEYNGSFWHSEEKLQNKFYHQEKTIECRNKGIRLIHIFDWEWDEKKEICKSIIESALGIYDKRIYARNCNVYEIKQDTYKDFLEENHLQGSINSSIRYGLYYQNELVSVIGFGKSRFKKDEMELHRYCNKKGYQILGGFSKLIKHSNVNNFITYVDITHFTGDGYKKIGFEEISITEPNYKWIGHGRHLNRLQCQKHKLHKLLETFDENKTEVENMTENGYIQVFDSGNYKLQYGVING